MRMTSGRYSNKANQWMPWNFYYPNNLVQSTSKIPIVLALHGNGQQGDGSMAGLLNLTNNNNFANLLKWAEIKGFAVFTPQFVQSSNYGPDLKQSWLPEWAGGTLVSDVVEWMEKNLQGVDFNRLYGTGLSGGGGAMWDAITRPELAKKFAAAIIICGTEISGGDWNAAKTVPLLTFHGDKDITVNVGASIRQTKYADGFLTIIPGGGHSIWGQVYDNLDVNPTGLKNELTYDWMLSKSKAPIVLPPPPIPTKTVNTIDFVQRAVKYSDGGWDSCSYIQYYVDTNSFVLVTTSGVTLVVPVTPK